jgi:hypothetical protein
MNDIRRAKMARHSHDSQLAVRAPAPCELNVDQVNIIAPCGNTEFD